MNWKVSILVVFIGSLFSCASTTYRVKKIDQPIQITGKGIDKQWTKAKMLTDFSYPWRSEIAPTTTFKALWDDTYLYFLYNATDSEIILHQDSTDELSALHSDRVEIFFKADDKMTPYYALELDALGRILDTEGHYYRDIDFDWDWPRPHLEVKANRYDKGYWVEGAISLASLRQLGMYQNDGLLQVALCRGEYVTSKESTTETKWISWIKPDAKQPDFHIPSTFGVFKLK